MTAVEWFVKGLQERGVEWVATLCGHGLDPFDYACRQAGLRLVDTRNEQTAAYMAEVHGRLTGRPGVVAVSGGVAHANAMTGVVDAWFDGAPMLLISGSHALETMGMGHFQDFDQVSLARPATKFSRVIDCPERTIQILDEAMATAAALPPGPVHLTFPMDVQEAEVAEDEMIRTTRPSIALARGDLREAVGKLAAAKQPLIVAGSGIHYAGEGQALCEFSERYSVPVVTPIWDRGSIDRPIESFVGVVGAATGGARLLPDADVIVMAGALPDYRVGHLQAGAIRGDAQVVRVDQGWREFAASYEIAGGASHGDWLAEARRRRQEFREGLEQKAAKQKVAGQAGDQLHASHLIRAVKQALTDDMVLLFDSGSFGQWCHQLLTDRYPSHWLTCGRSGVVGWGLGGAIAARLTYPERPVLLLAGDGSFTFTVSEIECAVRQGIGFVAVVGDDQSWGITQSGHVSKYGEAITSSLGPIDFVKLAESLGARGVQATTETEFAGALTEALASEAVTVIHAPIVGGAP
jgi:acetolactate synthase-1/2/3 large subunit